MPVSHPRGFSPAAPKPAEGRGDPIRAATTLAGELSGLCQPNKGAVSGCPDLDHSEPGEGEKMKHTPRRHRWRGVKGQLPLCLLAPCPGEDASQERGTVWWPTPHGFSRASMRRGAALGSAGCALCPGAWRWGRGAARRSAGCPPRRLPTLSPDHQRSQGLAPVMPTAHVSAVSGEVRAPESRPLRAGGALPAGPHQISEQVREGEKGQIGWDSAATVKQGPRAPPSIRLASPGLPYSGVTRGGLARAESDFLFRIHSRTF